MSSSFGHLLAAVTAGDAGGVCGLIIAESPEGSLSLGVSLSKASQASPNFEAWGPVGLF